MIYALLGIIGVFAGIGGVNNADDWQGIILSMIIGSLGFFCLIRSVLKSHG